MNLNVFLAKSGFCSRRDASVLVKEGKVVVNGKVVLEPWHKISAGDMVKANGRLLKQEKNVYIIFNKPKGVTTTLEDRFADSTVVDFIPKNLGRVYPVGRLDKPSRGLIILTNDGDLCYRLTHPKFEVEKEYFVTVKGRFDGSVISKLKRGVKDGEDILRVKSAYLEHADESRSRIRVIACEGKKRHLRRLFEDLGFEVTDLVRVRIGGLNLGSLKEGQFKVVDIKEVNSALEKSQRGQDAEKSPRNRR